MSPFKQVYYNLTSLLPVEIVKRICPSTTLFPYHHLVSDEEVMHIKHLYPYKNVKQFTADLEYLLKHLTPVSVHDLVTNVKKGLPLPANSFLLTFDDGFKEVYEVIAPILSKKGVPAVFFINPAFIDNKELFYRGKISLLVEQILKTEQKNIDWQKIHATTASTDLSTKEDLIRFIKSITNLNQSLLNELAGILDYSFENYLFKVKPFLTSDQIKKLSGEGFSIGSHSWDHPYYHLLSQEEQLRQTITSGNYVTEQFNQPHQLFSFPHYDTLLPQSFFDELSKQWNADILFGIQNQKAELQNKMVHRFNGERPELSMSRQLNGVLFLMLLQKMMGRNKVRRS